MTVGKALPSGGLAVRYAAAFAVALLCAYASAQTYPSRPIRLIVPFGPGTTDIIARMVNVPLGERLGQPIVVDNRAGASTVIGAEIAARAPADGHTLFMATVSTLVVVPLTRSKLPFDVERDFAPVSMIAAQPYLMATHPLLPATTLAQFIAHAKANPGKLTYGSSGVAGSAHLAGEMLKQLAGIDVVHVPYKGGLQVVADTMNGRLDFMFATIGSIKPFAVSGKLRVLAVSTAKRSAAIPEVPTIAESGIPGYQTNSWNALVVPRATSAGIINRLNAELRSILGSAEMRERFLQQGIEPNPGSPEDLTRFVKEERDRFTKLIKATGIKAE